MYSRISKIKVSKLSKILGCYASEFYRLLSEHGFYVIDYSEEDLEEEAKQISYGF